MSAINNPLQYTGRENDETGLYFYRNRYYSPSLRRFISRDPLREAAGENEYAYVSNSPTNFTDPLGLEQEGPVNQFGTIGNILADGDAVAADAWIIGNECNPISERRWAAARMAGRVLFAAFGGAVIGRFLGIGGRLLKAGGQALFKRIPCTPLTKWLGKACFTKGTLIHTKEGLKPIEEIEAGDEVLSYNEQTKQTEYKSVIETYIRQTETIVKIQVEAEEKILETTLEHPFYVRIHKARDSIGDDGEWRAAGELQIGDEVLTASGEWQRITDYEQQSRDEEVYNFAVEDNNNYFVGQSGTLVHNTCFTSTDPLVGQIANAIEARFPGHVVGVNVKLGGHEIDILTKNAIIEVKAGGKGLLRQVLARDNLGYPVIAYSPNLGRHAINAINNAGGIATNSLKSLLDIIGP